MPSKLASILGAGGLALVTAEAPSSLHQLIAENEIGVAVDPENLRLIYNAIERVVISTSNEMNLLDQHQHINLIDVQQIRKNALQYAENHLSKEVLIDNFMKQVAALN
jgi:glycosyltransferase involved in cell wall biosynthesis